MDIPSLIITGEDSQREMTDVDELEAEIEEYLLSFPTVLKRKTFKKEFHQKNYIRGFQKQVMIATKKQRNEGVKHGLWFNWIWYTMERKTAEGTGSSYL